MPPFRAESSGGALPDFFSTAHELPRSSGPGTEQRLDRRLAPAWSAEVPYPRTIPLLPCSDIDEIEPFFATLGFRTTYLQLRPNPALGLNGHGFDLQYYGLDGHTPESSHSSCLVIVDDTGQIWEEFAAGLRKAYGKLPIKGFPRITRRAHARTPAGPYVSGWSGFSLVDPAGNWHRFFRDGSAETSPPELSRLGEAVQNAVVLADSKGDVAQAAKVLRGAIKRASADDPAQGEARSFIDELTERLSYG